MRLYDVQGPAKSEQNDDKTNGNVKLKQDVNI